MRIVAVAIRYKGTTYSMPKPKRHYHVIQMIHKKTGAMNIYSEQGFLLEDGSFIDRYQGAELALKSGQVTKLRSPPWLFSEDLW